MSTSSEIQKRLKDAGLSSLIPAYVRASATSIINLDEFNSCFVALIDYHLEDCLERKFETNVVKAQLPYVGITINDVDLKNFPSLRWYQLEIIRSGKWVRSARSVLIHGNDSVAQSKLGSAICSELMLKGLTLHCYSLKDLTYQLLKAQAQQQVKKFVTSLKRLDLLFIYDFEPRQLTPMECYWLSNLLDARNVAGGFLISSMSTPTQWCKDIDDLGLIQRIQAIIEPDLISFEFVRANKETEHE